jgi:hypothetical protein
MLEHCPDERAISGNSPSPTRSTEVRDVRFQKVLPILDSIAENA